MWHARRQFSSMGWPGIAGMALVAFSVAFFFSAIVPLKAHVQELKADVESLGIKLKADPSGRGLAGSGGQLANFYAFFPPFSTTPEWLQRIFDLAGAQGLRLEAGEYKLIRERDLRLARYEVALPVRGTYAQIREFVAQVLAEVPASSLDELSLKRDDPASASVEARIRLTLYLAGERLP